LDVAHRVISLRWGTWSLWVKGNFSLPGWDVRSAARTGHALTGRFAP